MSKHTQIIASHCRLTVTIPVKFWVPGCLDAEVANLTVDLEYTYMAGDPGCRTLYNGDPGWPPTGAELDLITATLVDGDGIEPSDQQVTEWAGEWLDDKGYDCACQHAERTIADVCGND